MTLIGIVVSLILIVLAICIFRKKLFRKTKPNVPSRPHSGWLVGISTYELLAKAELDYERFLTWCADKGLNYTRFFSYAGWVNKDWPGFPTRQDYLDRLRGIVELADRLGITVQLNVLLNDSQSAHGNWPGEINTGTWYFREQAPDLWAKRDQFIRDIVATVGPQRDHFLWGLENEGKDEVHRPTRDLLASLGVPPERMVACRNRPLDHERYSVGFTEFHGFHEGAIDLLDTTGGAKGSHILISDDGGRPYNTEKTWELAQAAKRHGMGGFEHQSDMELHGHDLGWMDANEAELARRLGTLK